MTIKELVKKFIPHFSLDFYHYLLALFGAIIFWFPSRKMTVIGVTGTSGKSTTVDFITRILEEVGNKVVSNSSIRFKIRNKEWPNDLKMGMPGRFFMQKLLRQGVNQGCNYAVLEVTSEGIKQFRHKFIYFNTAVFTNLSPEHIESHGGFENYRNEKLKLFSAGDGSAFGGKAKLNTHIVNIDDENAKYFLEIPARKTIIFGTDYACKINGRQLYKHKEEKEQENYSDTLQNDSILAENVNGMSFVISGTQFNLNVLGQFNVYNALAAIAVANAHGVSLEICKRALEKIQGIPGRMEIVSKNPLVVVDYAHTPDQLEQAYKSFTDQPPPCGATGVLIEPEDLRAEWPVGPAHELVSGERAKLICVLGSCGGGRDKWKRPVLGKIAEKYCSQIIITNEDPYDENPMDIINQVVSGIQYPTPNTQHLILDRKEAIKKAILLAKPEDIVIITGKGSETWMCVENGKKIPWDDRQIAREALNHNPYQSY